MDEMEEMRLWFTEVLWTQADLRKEKAAKYPDDERHSRAAEGITELGKWFTLLPDFDPLVESLMDALLGDDSDNLDRIADSLENRVSLFRFDESGEAFAPFLERLTADIGAGQCTEISAAQQH